VGIGFIFIYDGTDRGELCAVYSFCHGFTRGTLVVHTHDIPLDPFKVCLYDHNKIIGIAFEVSILVFGMFPSALNASSPNHTHDVGCRHGCARCDSD